MFLMLGNHMCTHIHSKLRIYKGPEIAIAKKLIDKCYIHNY
jgi:hypothetical protein